MTTSVAPAPSPVRVGRRRRRAREQLVAEEQRGEAVVASVHVARGIERGRRCHVDDGGVRCPVPTARRRRQARVRGCVRRPAARPRIAGVGSARVTAAHRHLCARPRSAVRRRAAGDEEDCEGEAAAPHPLDRSHGFAAVEATSARDAFCAYCAANWPKMRPMSLSSARLRYLSAMGAVLPSLMLAACKDPAQPVTADPATSTATPATATVTVRRSRRTRHLRWTTGALPRPTHARRLPTLDDAGPRVGFRGPSCPSGDFCVPRRREGHDAGQGAARRTRSARPPPSIPTM